MAIGHHDVAALLAYFLESCFGAIDPFGHAIFGIIAGTRSCLRHDGADRQISPPQEGRTVAADLAQFLRQSSCAFSIDVSGKMNTSDHAVYFTATSVCRTDEQERAGQLIDVVLDRWLAMLAQQVRFRDRSG